MPHILRRAQPVELLLPNLLDFFLHLLSVLGDEKTEKTPRGALESSTVVCNINIVICFVWVNVFFSFAWLKVFDFYVFHSLRVKSQYSLSCFVD
jgi:hypothetical protein